MCGVRGARGQVHETDLETSRLETTNSNSNFEIINDESEKTLFEKWCDFLWTMRQKKNLTKWPIFPFKMAKHQIWRGLDTDTRRSSMPSNMGPTNWVIDKVNHKRVWINRIHATYIGGLWRIGWNRRSSVPFNMGPTNRVINKVNHR